MDEMSRSEQFNLVEGEHTTGSFEKDSVETDLDVDVDVGEILGRDDYPVSSVSGTREAVDRRPGSYFDLGRSKNF